MTAFDTLPVPSSTLRGECTQLDLSANTSTFVLGPNHKSYRHQFANIYYDRLTSLKNVVTEVARKRWRGSHGSPPLVPRVLDVEKSQVCFIVGTVYMEMSQKPNVLEDVGRDRYLPEPAPREKYLSDEDTIMLEDESGRVQLVGDILQRVIDGGNAVNSEGGYGNSLVTGVIMAALGRETSSGAFEVKDVCFAGMAPMLYETLDDDQEMELDEADPQDDWVAFLSGLEMGSSSDTDPRIQALVEYLCAEGGVQEDNIPRISRLIIAGNSLAPVAPASDPKPTVIETGSKSKRFGQEASNFSPVPTNSLGDFLYDVADVMPIHLLAGASDPSGTLLPQQALPRAMFGDVKALENFNCETNPVWLAFEAGFEGTRKKSQRRSMLVHSGQAIDDMYKYVPSPPTSRLDLACTSLQWRHIAPTAPDTLWCYPFIDGDPFTLKRTPDIYVIGCQPEFATRLVSSSINDRNQEVQTKEPKCRVILVPAFKETYCLVLVNMRNLEVKCVEFGLEGRLKDAIGLSSGDL